MKTRVLLLVAALAVTLAGPAPAAGSAASAPSKETRWEDLVPKGWDPTRGLRGVNAGRLSDTDPRVLQMMREMREAWDSAPTNPQMDGVTVKLPGYVVPLDEVNGELKEFLLVPYFGACVHTPPPPANQIVHVTLGKPLKGFRMMDAVWVSGTLKAIRSDSAMGTSGYHVEAPTVDRYVAPAR